MVSRICKMLFGLKTSSPGKHFMGAILIGFAFVAIVTFSPLLSVTSAKNHHIALLTDVNDDGNLDLLMSDGDILVSNGNGRYLSNEIIFKDGIPAQRSYLLSNNTALPDDKTSSFINLTYMEGPRILGIDDHRMILMVTPSDGTATIFSETAEGDFYPTMTISVENPIVRDLQVTSEELSGNKISRGRPEKIK